MNSELPALEGAYFAILPVLSDFASNPSSRGIWRHGFDPGTFRQPERARRDLESIAARAPQTLLAAMVPLLAEAPDADQALNLLERLLAAGNGPLAALLNRNRTLLHYTLAIFGHSHWIGETLIQNHDLFAQLQREKNLERSLERDDYRENFARFRSQSHETDISWLLARFRKREYVRITLRDILGIATLAETTAEISSLSDVLIEEALRAAQAQMRNRYGAPEYHDAQGRVAEAPFAVLSLGKLGGAELNYSSDVDLLYLYGDYPATGDLALREYFIRQAQLLTELLSRSTTEGAVFRIDLRLRPQGQEGEPATGIRHALNYYAHAAHDWELQALIKVRHSAGDQALARRFIHAVEPCVYGKTINFEAIETALLSREKIGAHRRRLLAVSREPAAIDVKLDRGGIRDIEFLVQCLQRVYGGQEQWLRPGGTLFSLQKLHDKGHLSGKDFHDLSLAYEFLRKVEHRLQLQHARQTHRLPPSPEDLRVLYRAVDSNAASENPAALLLAIQSHMVSVAEIYERMVRRQKRIEKAETETFRLTPPPERELQDLSFQQVLQRIALDSPALHALVTCEDLSVHARRNMHRFLSSAMTTAERYRSLIENPAAMRQAIALFATSDYLTGILLRHPGVLPVLNHLPGPQEQWLLEFHPAEAFAYLHAVDASEALAGLRSTYRRLIFSSAAKDVLHGREAEDSLRENSLIADAAIGAALRIAGGEDSLAVFALGRLGTMEFDIASDADLIFVRAPHTDAETCRAIAEKLIHALAAYTKEGTVFAVDTRLRPRGNDGELVVTPLELDAYLKNEAHPWEALTYAKLRPVAGSSEIAGQVLPQVWKRITAMAGGLEFMAECAQMRLKLEKSDRFPASFKLMPGGFYDIDFLASLLALRSGDAISETTVTRLCRLHQAGLLESSAEMELRHAAIFYRSVDHAVRLVTGRAANALPAAEHARQATAELLQRMQPGQSSETLEAELQRTATQVRAVFNTVFFPKLPGAALQ